MHLWLSTITVHYRLCSFLRADVTCKYYEFAFPTQRTKYYIDFDSYRGLMYSSNNNVIIVLVFLK